jgi:hypothetical protein
MYVAKKIVILEDNVFAVIGILMLIISMIGMFIMTTLGGLRFAK